ncbi:hypothetical protein L1987_57043 [Smallanthus sonchifolius]|uniref:Uncharacterized protein n=1 Tax=Smallanthus sonchifolius TaxID=185202 RepID=A0ACB9DBU1_9ASTR|nr:hypothetical protein L1987_57043 [Smallanthus sonchifolius]
MVTTVTGAAGVVVHGGNDGSGGGSAGNTNCFFILPHTPPLPLPFHSIDCILVLTLKFIGLCSRLKVFAFVFIRFQQVMF